MSDEQQLETLPTPYEMIVVTYASLLETANAARAQREYQTAINAAVMAYQVGVYLHTVTMVDDDDEINDDDDPLREDDGYDEDPLGG